MIKLLLDQGATINAFDKKDRRAIHWAAYMGHVEIVKMLVDHGAELNCQDKQVCRLFESLKPK
jgi:serine/threonine-protein phosphatase 6 regulatory ankyrin repeat subunit A